MKFVIIGVLIFAIIGGFLFWRFGPFFNSSVPIKKDVTLTLWGLWEEEELMKPVIELYKKTHPNVTINYVYQSSLNYRSRVQTQISEGEGPDIFMIHNTWLPMFLKTNSLSVAPSSVFNMNDYSTIFYPIARESLTKNSQIYGIPRGIDGLALFVNTDILKAGGVGIPQNWDQFRSAAVKLTVSDQKGKIQTAGAALGTATNVDHFSDILGLLYLQQPNGNLENPGSPEGVEVLKFYTDFVIDPTKKVWDQSMEPSTQAFAGGRLAFYFAPSWRAHELRTANPQLNFTVAPVPQLPGRNVAWANFWAYGVSVKSQNQNEAWEFLKFLTSQESERTLYQEASKVRLFGMPYSRVDMAKEISSDPLAGAFVNQAPFYKSWYLASKTADNGLNDEMIKYFEDAVNAVVTKGQTPQVALQTVDKGVNQVLDKYVRAAPPPSGK